MLKVGNSNAEIGELAVVKVAISSLRNTVVPDRNQHEYEHAECVAR